MLDLLTDVVGLAEGRCSYAEARHVAERREDLEVRGGAVDEASHETVEGIGVRVRVGGAWGFAATADVSRAGAETALERALAFAAAQPAGADRPLTAVEAARGSWASPCERDPFDVPLEDKLALLAEADSALRGDARIARSHARLTARRIHKHFASTEGSALEQVTVLCGAGLQAIAVDEHDLQVRSYPTGHGGDTRAAGWEHILALDLVGNAPRVAEEAIALLGAPPCPEGPRTIVLHGEQLALQTHESIGHALELDRILLGEASYAGTSWVGTDDLDPAHPLRYGSELLNVTADATVPGGLGTYGWDDEGVAARRTPLIEAGVLRAALSDRESAAAVGLDGAGGCARADGFARQPIVRMTNVNVEPGDAGSLADLLADTEDGLYFETNKSWSIDDRRLQFQFGTEVCREIRDGELGRLYRNASYAGITPQFWGSLDAVCGEAEWRLWGLTNCGKGEPGQIMEVSHGTSPGRFRDVQVGVA